MSVAAPSAKSCGSCTLCCKVLGIMELEKPAWDWCPHCTPGKGCGIYEARPTSCRAFDCQWIVEPALAEAFKPDRSKVVLVGSPGPIINAYCDPSQPLAWKREPMHALLRERARTRWGGLLAVVARAGLRTWLINGDGDTDLGEVDPRSEVRFERLPGGPARAIVLPPAPGAKPAPGYF